MQVMIHRWVVLATWKIHSGSSQLHWRHVRLSEKAVVSCCRAFARSVPRSLCGQSLHDGHKDRFRDASHSIINSCGTICINDTWVGDPIVLQKAEAIALRILKVDAEKDDPLALYTPPCGLEERRFMFARVTPRCPEVKQHGFS